MQKRVKPGIKFFFQPDVDLEIIGRNALKCVRVNDLDCVLFRGDEHIRPQIVASSADPLQSLDRLGIVVGEEEEVHQVYSLFLKEGQKPLWTGYPAEGDSSFSPK